MSNRITRRLRRNGYSGDYIPIIPPRRTTVGELAIEAERHGVVHHKGWTLSYGGSVDISEHVKAIEGEQ